MRTQREEGPTQPGRDPHRAVGAVGRGGVGREAGSREAGVLNASMVPTRPAARACEASTMAPTPDHCSG